MNQDCPDTLAAAADTATAFKVIGPKGERKAALSSLPHGGVLFSQRSESSVLWRFVFALFIDA